MRKLKLQIQVSADGFIAETTGNTSWMVWNWGKDWSWDKQLRKYFTELKSTIDCIFLSRKMAEEGFIDHWKKVATDQSNPQAAFAKYIAYAHKLVFSRTLEESAWENTEIAGPDLVTEINRLKNQPGKDIMVYGGASFVSSLIENGLIDEFYLFVNPVVLGNGMSIFRKQIPLNLISSRSFSSGIVINKYIPAL